MWKTVLFDLDGTLLDYRRAQEGALSDCCSELGLEPGASDRGLLREFIDSEPVQAIEACRPGAPGTSAPSVCSGFPLSGAVSCPEFLDAYFRALAGQCDLIDGALEILAEIRPGCRTAVVSNGPGPVQRSRMEGSGLMQYFDAIVISCEIGLSKPDPGIFEIALRILSAPRESAVVLGDGAVSDMQGAEAAGLDFVYFRPDGVFVPEGRRVAQITDLREFPGLPGFREAEAGASRQ